MRSIDFHIGLPGTARQCHQMAAFLLFLGFDRVDLPPRWKNSGLQWFQKEGIQIQLIPKTFLRNDSQKKSQLHKFMTTLPHIAFNVSSFPSKENIKTLRLHIIEGPLTRPDGLEQLYLMGHSKNYFLELNLRNETLLR